MARRRIKRKGDSYIKDALILLGITVILAGILVLVFNTTKKPIDEASKEGKLIAYKNVFKEYGDVDVRYDDELSNKIKAYTPDNKDVRIEEGALIYDKSNKSLGRAYIVSTKGYSTQNNITMSIGFDENNVITSLEIVSMNETAGLGANCTSDEFKGQFKGKSNELGVSRSKTPGDDEISAISGATITSKAVTAGVNECIKLNQSI
ncbi:MAG: FMN-binding protein [Lachnospiraceae bacterium]|nr:FMN-binding protein [Lachnoclostridium sp.]MDD7521009.1 FMN-binding protein [Lachnoclostridium sp.]MDY2599917.1 FMN-binding protein [Lachnospiraceae bacterium]